MITIETRDSEVIIHISTGLAVERNVMVLGWDAKTPIAAEAIKQLLKTRLDSKIRNLKQNQYLLGYKDGRLKKAKTTFFDSYF